MIGSSGEFFGPLAFLVTFLAMKKVTHRVSIFGYFLVPPSTSVQFCKMNERVGGKKVTKKTDPNPPVWTGLNEKIYI